MKDPEKLAIEEEIVTSVKRLISTLNRNLSCIRPLVFGIRKEMANQFTSL